MSTVRFVLTSSRRAIVSLEESADYFSGAEVALHNLRWQLLGFTATYPNATQDEVSARFATGTGLKGSNAFNLVLRRGWGEMVALHTDLRLINLISIYEGWSHAAAAELQLSKAKTDKFDKLVQGLAPISELSSIVGAPLSCMAEIATSCAANKSNRAGRIDDLLICYRAFKELRNSLAHSAREATDRAEAAYLAYQGVLSNWQGITQHHPELPPVDAGAPVVLTTRGILGLAAVLQLTIASFDVLLSDSPLTLVSVKHQWRRTHGNVVTLPAEEAKAKGRFLARWKNTPLPPLATGGALLQEFRQSGIVW